MIFAFIFISIFTVLSAGSVKEKPPVQLISPYGKCEEFVHVHGSNKYVAEVKYCGVKK